MPRFIAPRRHAPILGLLIPVVLAGQTVQPALPTVQCASAPVVIRASRLFDGQNMRSGMDVLVQGDTIAAVGPSLKVPPGTAECVAPGRTLLPGLIDSHVHVQDSVSLNEALIMGVTTELDMFSQVDTVARALRVSGIANSSPILADIRTSGILITAPGGHGTEYGYAIPTLSSPDSADALVSLLISQGSDYIKIVYDNASEWGVSMPTLDSATLTAAIAAAHRHGKLAIVHIGSRDGARAALRAGADGLAHLFADSMPHPNFGDTVFKRGAFVITTFTPLLRLSLAQKGQDPAKRASALMSHMDSLQLSELNANFNVPDHADMRAANALAAELRVAGVRVLAGTDAPNPGTAHGVALHMELASLVDAGFSPVEALRSATSVPASTFGLTDRGMIRPGARADLLLVTGDPSVDIRATRAMEVIWKRGATVPRVSTPPRTPATDPGAQAPTNEHRFEPTGPEPAAGAGESAAPWVEWTPLIDQPAGSVSQLDIALGGSPGNKHSLRVTGIVGAGAAGVQYRARRTLMAPPPFLPFAGFDVWTRGDSVPAQVRLRLTDGTLVTQPLTMTSPWTQSHFTFAQFGVPRGRVAAIEFVELPSATRRPFLFQVDDLVLR